MSLRIKIAFCLYALVSLGSIASGLLYISSPQIMPYHLQVINRSWADLDSRLQMMFLALLKTTGIGVLGGGLSMGILILIPFRRGQKWAYMALPIISFICCAPAAYIAYSLHHSTGASTPWLALVITLVIILMAFLLTIKQAGKAG